MPVKVAHKITFIENLVDIQEWNSRWVKPNYTLLEIKDVGNLYFHDYLNFTGIFMGIFERTEYESFAIRCSYVYTFEPLEDVSYV